MAEDIVLVSGTTPVAYRVYIDSSGHMHVSAITEKSITHYSHASGLASIYTSGELPVTATGGRMFYVKNNSSTNFWIQDIIVGWNGGDTTKTAALVADLYTNDPAPTANTVDNSPDTNTPAGMNLSLNAAGKGQTVFYWDGVGNGMTVGAGGFKKASYIIGQQSFKIPMDGALILGIDNSIGINLKGEELGNATITVSGFYNNIL